MTPQELAARQSASLNWLRSTTFQANIRDAQKMLSANLNRYDEIAGNAQGTSALALARSGMMSSRRRSAFATKDQLGINYDVTSPLSSVTETKDSLQAVIDQYNAFDTQIASIQSQIGAKRGAIDALRATRDITQEERYLTDGASSTLARLQSELETAQREANAPARERKREISQQISDLRDRIRGGAESGDMSADDAAALRDQISALEEERDSIDLTNPDSEEISRIRGEIDAIQEDEGSYATRQIKIGEEEYFTNPEEYSRLIAEIEGLEGDIETAKASKEAFKTSEEVTSRGGFEIIMDNVAYLDELLTKMEEFQAGVEQEAGAGVADLQQLSFTRGSTLAMVSRGLEQLRQQRDQVLYEGVRGAAQFIQGQMNAEQQAEFDAEAAQQYMQLASQQQQQEDINFLFQGLGLLGGAIIGGMTGGVGVGAGMAIGSSAGSFLGQFFSRG